MTTDTEAVAQWWGVCGRGWIPSQHSLGRVGGRRGRCKLGIIQNRKRNASYHGEMVHTINVRSVNLNRVIFLPPAKICIIKEERNERSLERIYMCSQREENQKYSTFSVRISH